MNERGFRLKVCCNNITQHKLRMHVSRMVYHKRLWMAILWVCCELYDSMCDSRRVGAPATMEVLDILNEFWTAGKHLAAG